MRPIGWFVALALATPGPVAMAEEPPLVVFHARAGAPAEVAATRDALARVARAEGTTLIDRSPPPPREPGAPAALRRAIEAYGAFHYDEALTALDAALAEAQASGAAGLGSSELSDLLLYRGLVKTRQGDTIKAWDDFVRAATVDPARRLDPLRFPPRSVQTFNLAADQVQKGARGSIVVPNVPQGCSLFVDGRRGEGVLFPFGEHYVRVECEGAPPFGAVVPLAQALQPVAADVRPYTTPTDAEVLAYARERGAKTVVYVSAGVAGPGGLTLTLRLLGAVQAVAFASGAEGPAALRRLIGKVVRPVRLPLVPPAPVVIEREPPWYRTPWFWGLAATTVTAAVVLAFTLDEPQASGVRVELGGDTW